MAQETLQPYNSQEGTFWSVQNVALALFLLISTIVAAVFWWVTRSTFRPGELNIKEAYKLRKIFFFAGFLVLTGATAATLLNNPYGDRMAVPDKIVYVTSRQFGFLYSNNPIINEAGLAGAEYISSLEIPAGSLVEFRVTSLDVTHGFAIYGPDQEIVSQVQAMPGYTNRLMVRFATPGRYNVLCLEYCGGAHHVMRSGFIVR